MIIMAAAKMPAERPLPTKSANTMNINPMPVLAPQRSSAKRWYSAPKRKMPLNIKEQ